MPKLVSSGVLYEEKKLLLSYMKYRVCLAPPPAYHRSKNTTDSTNYRKAGNKLYSARRHDARVHEKIWKLYSQSIALAPNNSEELALGYGNRSALLLHLTKFEDCIKDCDRAANITGSNFLKCKLLCRKAECLMLLKKSSAKDVALEALQLLEELTLENSIKCNLLDKLNNILIITRNMRDQNGRFEKKNYFDKLTKFPRLEEAPCASKSVAIKYNENWGRHVVATQNIRPGEIIAVEESYYTYIQDSGMYLFCSNCTQYTWSSIPCEHCIYDVYCSEFCRSEAWRKYHQFECPVYPHLWDIDKDINVLQCSTRLMLIAINEAGGISRIKEEIVDIENCKDPRVKGFTDGVFRSDKAKSLYSLPSKVNDIDPVMNHSLIENICTVVYLFATYTNLFGDKLVILPSKMFLNEDVLFVAALLLRTLYVTPKNASKLSYVYGTKIVTYAIAFKAFTSLINHSCDPNTDFYMAKNNKIIIYARYPIEKGSQLFVCYNGDNFLHEPKEDRQFYLKEAFGFTCDCLPCVEDWSTVAVPSLEQLMDVTPALCLTVHRMFNKMQLMTKLRTEEEVVYSPKLMNDTIDFLETLAKRITIHCEDYFGCLNILTKLLHDVFGFWIFEVPNECYIP